MRSKPLKQVKPVSKAVAKSVGKRVGEVTHYFPNVKAAILKVEKPLSIGDQLLISGKQGQFKQRIKSMQINRIPIDKARPGEEIGLEVKKVVSVGDIVFKIT